MSTRPLKYALRMALCALPVLATLNAPQVRAADPAPRPLASKQQSPAQRLEQRVQAALERARLGQTEAAIASLQAVLDERSDHFDVRLILAALWAGRGAVPQAQAILEQGLAIAPLHGRLRMNLARLQIQASQVPAALATLEAGLSPESTADYQAFHAVVLQAEGQHARAVTQYAAALREQPFNAQWLVGIGVSLRALGLNEASREAFERARGAPDFNRRLAEVVAQYGVIP